MLGTPQKEHSGARPPKTVPKSRPIGSPRAPQMGKLNSNYYLLHFRYFDTPRKSTILDHFGVPKSMQKQGLQTNAPKSYKKRVPRVLRGCPGSTKGAAQERERAPESPRGLQRGSPLGGHEPTDPTAALSKRVCCLKEQVIAPDLEQDRQSQCQGPTH